MSPMNTRVASTSSVAKIAAAVGVPLLALITAACGGTGSASSSSVPGAVAGASAAGLAVANTSLGPVLVNAQGMTVYLLTADSPGMSSCSAPCLANWPAVSGVATGGPGVVAKVGQATTTGGASILTAGGWPLYTFVQDHAPGDVSGEGVQSFGGTWYAVSPSGQPVKTAASSSARSY